MNLEELKRVKMVIDSVKTLMDDAKKNYIEDFGAKMNKKEKAIVDSFAGYVNKDLIEASKKFEEMILKETTKA